MAASLNAADNAIQTNIGNLQTQVGQNTENISGLQETVADHQTQINNVAEQANAAFNGMQTNTQNISELQTQVGQNTENISGLQETVADHQTQINNVAEQANAAFNGMTQNTQDINDLQTQVETNKTDIGELQSTAADHQTQINNVAEQANAAFNGMQTNTQNISKLQNQVGQNSTDIGTLRDDTNTLRTDVNTLRDDTNTLRTDVNTLRTDTDTLRTDVDTNTQNIQNNKTAIDNVNKVVGSGVLTSGATDLTTGINQNYAQIQQNTNAINSLDSRVDDLGGEIDQVGAISAALAGLHPLDYDGTGSKFQLSAAMGSYDSTQAAAIGAFYHFNRDVMISLGGATSFDGDHKTAGNLGVTFRIGEGASGSAVSDDVMARLEAMDQKIAALEQENKDLKNVLGTIDTSLSKEFPDVPANHWAYEAVTKLAGNDVVAGYPDGEFHGDRTMTRYEMAEIIYKAMSKGVQVDQKLVEEFKPEMEQVAANQNA